MDARGLGRWWAVIVAALSFAALQHYTWAQVGDDSFIYFRYAERAAQGLLSWSNGDPNVEGYSSPLWLGLLVLGVAVGAPVVVWAKVLGTVCAMATFAAVVVLARRAGGTPVAVGAACLVWSVSAGVHFWAASGLETSLYAALFTWTAVALLAGGRWWVIPTMLIGIARPEGPAMVVAAIVLVTLRDRKVPPVGAMGLALFPAAAWEVFRLLEYGVPLPNTYYAKATGGTSQLMRGLRYASPLLLAAVPLLLGWRPGRPRGAGPLVGVLWGLALLAVVVGGGGDWMWHHRLLVPVLPVFVALGAPLWSHGIRGKLLVLFGLVALVPNTTAPTAWIRDALRGEKLPIAAFQEGEMFETSRALADDLQARYATDTLVAVNHAGALPYYSGFRAIDMTGLNDVHIARVSGELHAKYDPDYVLGREPDLVVLNSRVRPGEKGAWYHPGYWVGETALVSHPDFVRCYAPLEVVATWRWIATGDNFIVVFERTCD